MKRALKCAPSHISTNLARAGFPILKIAITVFLDLNAHIPSSPKNHAPPPKIPPTIAPPTIATGWPKLAPTRGPPAAPPAAPMTVLVNRRPNNIVAHRLVQLL